MAGQLRAIAGQLTAMADQLAGFPMAQQLTETAMGLTAPPRLTNPPVASTAADDRNGNADDEGGDGGNEDDDDGDDEWTNDGNNNYDDDDSNEERNDIANAMPPPPEEMFATFEELKTRVEAWTFEHRYELVIAASQKGKRKWVRCGRSGKPRNSWGVTDENRRRRCSSHKTGCTMGLYYVPHADGSWSIRHYKNGKSFHHNHEPVAPDTTTANHRRSRRTAEMRDLVRSHIESGVTARQSVAIIKTFFPDSFQTKKDISNMKTQYNSELKCRMVTG
ncbi:MAG: hypothetical protein M1815_001671 [Lichina confinis]|nr:MAG: hypothetical protein M1815_001671 [Lichina confinis]